MVVEGAKTEFNLTFRREGLARLMGYPCVTEEIALGDIIRYQRQKLGLSARALSLQAGLSPSYVGKLESGDIEPSVRAFAQLVTILKMAPFEVYLAVMLERLRPMSPSTLTVVPVV